MDDRREFDRTPAMLRRACSVLRVVPKLTPDEWGAKNRVYGPTTGMPGPRNPYLTPALVFLSKAAASGLYSRCVAVTAAQSGKTDSALDIIGQRLDQRPTPIIYVGPSVDFNKDQFEPRLRKMIDESRGLSDRLIRGRREKKTIKIVNGVSIRLASGGSSIALKSDPAGLAIVDEYDEMVANIRGQGDPLGLVEARGETYADFVTVITSTPGQGIVETEELEAGVDEDGKPIILEFFALGDIEEIASPIWRLFQEGTRHHFAWDCPHCGAPFIPMLKHLKWEKGASPAAARRTAYIECPNSGCVIVDDADEHSDYEKTMKASLNRNAFMIAPGQTVEDAKAERNQPDNPTYSQWASGLSSPFVTWGVRAERIVKAEMSGEEDKRQTTVNANFGEVFSPGLSGDMPDWKGLLEHCREYQPGTLPGGVLKLAMGVDVQMRGLYYVIRGFGARGSSWLISHGYLVGATAEDEVWNDLANVMLTPIQGLPIERVFIDSGYRPDKKEAGSIHRVYEFCRNYSFVATPCKTKSAYGGKPYTVSQLEVTVKGKRRPFTISLGTLDPDYFKSLVQTRIKTPLEQPGAFYLHAETDEDYARQVLSEVRLVTPGKNRPEWTPIRRDNHFFDCEALAAAAGYTLNVQSIPVGVVREEEPDEVKETVEIDPEADEAPSVDPAEARKALRAKFARFGQTANR